MIATAHEIQSCSSEDLLHQLGAFEPKNSVVLDFPDYVVRTAWNAAEVEQALRLRFGIFFHELNQCGIGEKIDIDAFDLIADHLLLIERKSDRVVGTYRFLCSRFTPNFYSQGEFDLKRILALPGEKLELGRACLHPAHRNSIAIQLLWKGMTAYFRECGARYMFGCSSVESHQEANFGMIHQWLMRHHLAPQDQQVTPRADLPLWMSLDCVWDENFARRAERLAPALLKAYLRAGSKVCGQPFWDPVCNTLDYFTLFDDTELTENYGRKFGLST
ncbi:MAG TPA: GNAT family N-acyltransferase [Fibrobacteraceae bacterium]|nr:GNAT family N-acyltransferase [Fibrobacteraceae bacterium]